MNKWGSVAEISTAIAAAGAILAAWRAWALAQRGFRYEAVGDLIKEYRTPEMGLAVKRLFDLRRKCKKDDCRMINRYVEVCKKEPDSPTNLHFQRRLVSTFYQNLTALVAARVLKRKEVYAILMQCSTSVIPILIPLDTRAVPLLRGEEIPKETPEDFKRLGELHVMAGEVYGATLWTRMRHRKTIRSWTQRGRR